MLRNALAHAHTQIHTHTYTQARAHTYTRLDILSHHKQQKYSY